MKSFEDFIGDEEMLQESRLLRKGVATLFASRVRSEGQKIEQKLSSAKDTLRPRAGESTDEQVRRLQEGLIDMCDAFTAQRKLLGNLTAIVVSGQLFNERTNSQIQKLLKKGGV